MPGADQDVQDDDDGADATVGRTEHAEATPPPGFAEDIAAC
jgi:hypothetical protein